jgi:hypothetical protein
MRDLFKFTTYSFACQFILVSSGLRQFVRLDSEFRLHDLYTDQANWPTAKKSPTEKPNGTTIGTAAIYKYRDSRRVSKENRQVEQR